MTAFWARWNWQFVKHFSGSTDLRRGNVLDLNLAQNTLKLAGRGAADLHFDARERERAQRIPLSRHDGLEGIPVELVALGGLGHVEVQCSRRTVDVPALEAVAVALATLGALERTRLVIHLALDQPWAACRPPRRSRQWRLPPDLGVSGLEACLSSLRPSFRSRSERPNFLLSPPPGTL